MIYGTDLTLTSKGYLDFHEEIIHPETPDTSTLLDSASVYCDAVDSIEQTLVYRYHQVYRKKDASVFKEFAMCYDITVVFPGKIDKEFIKTTGEFHPLKSTGKETYSEYYEVLTGEGIFLLQKNSRNNEVEEVIAVEAKPGDKIYIPANYGHVIINTSDEYLVVASLYSSEHKALMEPFLEKSGAAYYCVEMEEGKCEWVKNPAYKTSVGLKIKVAPNIEHPLCEAKDKPLYQAFVENPQCFMFLAN